MITNIYELSYTSNKGKSVPLSNYQDRVLLLVNTASKCGFTPQYKGLEELYSKYKDQGLEIIGFPCDQFGGQEPGSDDDIKQFCELNFGVTFPLSTKVEVNGENTHPVFEYIKRQAPGVLGSQRIKWNFTKFLVSKDGKTVKRYASTTKPEVMEDDVQNALKE